jgi:hypothetical protein
MPTSKSSIIKQLDTVIGKLCHLNYKIEGNQLQTAIREVSYTKEKLQSNNLKVRK